MHVLPISYRRDVGAKLLLYNMGVPGRAGGAGPIIFELNQATAILTVPLNSQPPFASLAIGQS